jgi:CRP-like cAMP-binding protein
MSTVVPTPVVNQLLDGLSARSGPSIYRECELVELDFGEVLYEPGQHIRDVYFPTASFISLVASVVGGATLQVALIGNEGMLGLPLVLGATSSPLRAQVQGAGGAWRMQAAHFHRVLGLYPALRQRLYGYVHLLIAQLGQTAACACFHVLEARLAQWLLLAHDRAHADRFYLTHAMLAGILGVRRSGVTTAAGALARRQLIHYSRGNITILDRKGLEAASCGCYRKMAELCDSGIH